MGGISRPVATRTANNLLTTFRMNRVPLKDVGRLLVVTVHNWHDDHGPRMGAALAYYVALSLAPAIVIILAVMSVASGARAAQGRLIWQMQDVVGREGAKVVQSMIEGIHHSSRGIVTTLLGLITLFFGGSAAGTELTDGLNTIWRVPEDTGCSRGRSLFNLAKERLLAFALVLGAGFFLLLSLIVKPWVAAAGRALDPFAIPTHALIQLANWVLTFALITALFAFLFKVLPEVRLKWTDVAAGAVVTSLLFTAGKLLLGVYLGKAGFADSYGAAGSLIAFLVWVYYSAQVFYLGAEFTRAYALRLGSIFTAKLDSLHA